MGFFFKTFPSVSKHMDHKLETLIMYNLSKIQVQESLCVELSGTLLSTLSQATLVQDLLKQNY